MQILMQFTIILLFCLYHIPALCTLRTYQSTASTHRTAHLFCGCLLYLAAFLLLTDLATGVFTLVLPSHCNVLFLLIPTALLIRFPKNHHSAVRCSLDFRPLTLSTITGCTTYLLGQCGEACALLLFLPLISDHVLLLYPVFFLFWSITFLCCRFFSSDRLRQSRLRFVLLFVGFLFLFSTYTVFFLTKTVHMS